MDGGLRAFQHFMDSGPGLMTWALLLFVVAGPVTLLHELGHAFAARRLLPGTVRIESGVGSRRWEFSLGGIDFRVSPLTAPLGHAGSCVYDGAPDAREAVWIALAGPAATALGFVASLAALPHTHNALREVVWMLVMMQGCSLVLNLAPFAVADRSGRLLRSDGMVALDAFRRARPARPRAAAAPVPTPAPTSSTSPACAECGHRRDEHVDLASGRRGACLGQDFDFQTLAAHTCACDAYVRL